MTAPEPATAATTDTDASTSAAAATDTPASDAAAGDEEHDWAAYYRYTLGREPRPIFLRGMAAVEAAGTRPGTALDIGAGDGTESLWLLERGWRVVSVDSAPQSAEVIEPRVPAARRHDLELVTRPADEVDLPPLDLVYSAYVLAYLAPDAFARLWATIRARLNPGGFLVVNLFGDRHEWAGSDPATTYLSRAEVDALLDGLEVLELGELEEDGASFVGPTHWHVWDVVARRPPG